MKKLLLVLILSLLISGTVYSQYVDRTKVTEAVPATATLQSAATANGNGSTLDVSGYSSVSFVVSGTFDAQINFEATADGTNWIALTALLISPAPAITDSVSAPGTFVAAVGSLKSVRARVSDFFSGSITVTARANLTQGAAPNVSEVLQGNPSLLNANVFQSIASNLKTSSETFQGGTAVGSGNPLQVTLANTGANSTAVKVDNSAVTQPVSAASLPLPSLAATSTKQSDGSQKTQVVDGSGNIIGATSNALDINIKSGNPTTITATQGTASNLNAQVQGAAASGASKAGNPVQTGGVFNTTQPTVTNGQAVENQATARGAQIVATGVDTFNTTINAALPAGSNVIGHVINDSGSTTAVTGNVTVVQGTGTNLHAVLDANSGVDIGKLTANQSVNVAQVGGTNTVNAGVAGVQAVGGNVANGGTATTNPVPVGGVFTTSPTTLTNGQTATLQFTAAQNAKQDITTIAGTAPTTAGKLDIKGADGDVFVRQATASNLHTAATLDAETTKVIGTVRVLGNGGGALDAATGAAPPANSEVSAGLGSGATGGFVLNMTVCDTFANINISSATTTLIVTGVSGRHVRICGLSMVTAAANNVAFISGTGATCGTGTTGMNGGTTAASGYNLAANGGIAQGSGIGVINQTNATGDSVCIVTSASTQLSGRLSYAIW